MISTLRRVAQQVPRMTRSMGGNSYIPKPDTSMDHVFGDSTFRLPFNFQPPSASMTFGYTWLILGVFGFPAWFMLYDDWKMQSFLEKLEAAKAKKASAGDS